MRNFMRSAALLLLALLITAVLFVGCKKEEAAAIEFWSTQTESDRQSTIQLLIDTFQALNPEITITLVPVEENDMPKQVAAAAAAGTLPAMAEFGSENAIDFGAEGLLDMDETSDLINSIGKRKFYAGALALLESPKKGSYYALPFHGWIQGIWYRSDWFKEAGLSPPNNWEAIEKAAKYFFQPDKNRYGILVGTTAEAYTEQCFTQFAISNKARLFDKNGNLVFNTPEMKETVEYYARLARSIHRDPRPGGPGTFTCRERWPCSSTYGVIVALGLFKQEDEAKTAAARRFIEYLFTEDGYVTFLHMAPGGMNPVIKGISDGEKFLADPKGIYKRYGKDKMGEIISGLENIMRFGIVDGNLIEDYGTIFSQQIIPQMMYKVTQENMDIDKAMSWAESEMKKVVQ